MLWYCVADPSRPPRMTRDGGLTTQGNTQGACRALPSCWKNFIFVLSLTSAGLLIDIVFASCETFCLQHLPTFTYTHTRSLSLALSISVSLSLSLSLSLCLYVYVCLSLSLPHTTAHCIGLTSESLTWLILGALAADWLFSFRRFALRVERCVPVALRPSLRDPAQTSAQLRPAQLRAPLPRIRHLEQFPRPLLLLPLKHVEIRLMTLRKKSWKLKVPTLTHPVPAVREAQEHEVQNHPNQQELLSF